MKANSPMQTRLNRTVAAASLLTLAAAALFVWTPGRSSHAQQEPNRQLVQPGSPSTNTSKRIALVIGNGAYTSAPPLKNPPNDARDMAATLRALGFDVTHGINVNQRDMKRLIREFGQKLKTGGSGLFYYAGHGVQSKGRNYLVPVDAEIQSEAEVEDSSVDASLVLNYMDDAQNGLNIVILDACRNNPFARSFRSASSGLAQVDAPTGTLIAYATAPGRVASDGTGQNGLYTSELLKQMRVPGLSVIEMFMRVRAEVMKQTGSKQVPWEASSLVGMFYFSAPRNATPAGAAADATKIDPAAFELSYWETIKNSSNPADFKSYLEQYPSGQFAPLARNRLTMLDRANRASNPPLPKPAEPGDSDTASEKAALAHLKRAYQQWLSKDVVYTITLEERRAFLRLASDDELERFIEQFWRRRDPTPGTELNEFREEYYNRFSQANEKFSGDLPGWRTARGRIYITLGPPDEIRKGASAEVWFYRHTAAYGNNVEVEFTEGSGSDAFQIRKAP